MASSKKIAALKARVKKCRAAYLKQIALETAAHANPNLDYGEVWRIEGGGTFSRSTRLHGAFMHACDVLRREMSND